jgi:prenyltransferase beta subunit
MKLLEKPSGIIFRLFSDHYLKAFRENSPEQVLKRSLKVMDNYATEELREYVKNSQAPSGGFKDKAGRADIYYTLFGHYLADALELNESIVSISGFTESCIRQNNPEGVNLYCAAILSARSGNDQPGIDVLWNRVRHSINGQLKKQPAYGAFLTLLTCYYLNDFKTLYLVRKQLNVLNNTTSLPCPVVAALLVLQRSFNKPVEELKNAVFSFYRSNGGFNATPAAPVPDLLSTAVALYALRFAGADLRRIKPDCLGFVDSLYNKGGFGANAIDLDPDIEYTFYGLLALGALAD